MTSLDQGRGADPAACSSMAVWVIPWAVKEAQASVRTVTGAELYQASQRSARWRNRVVQRQVHSEHLKQQRHRRVRKYQDLRLG